MKFLVVALILLVYIILKFKSLILVFSSKHSLRREFNLLFRNIFIEKLSILITFLRNIFILLIKMEDFAALCNGCVLINFIPIWGSNFVKCAYFMKLVTESGRSFTVTLKIVSDWLYMVLGFLSHKLTCLPFRVSDHLNNKFTRLSLELR